MGQPAPKVIGKWLGRVKTPRRHRGDDHHAIGIGDIGGLARCAPVSLEGVELNLGHDDPEGAAGRIVDPARQVEPRAAADCAKGEEGRLTVPHRFVIVRAESVAGAHKAGREAPVTGGKRPAFSVQRIDGGRAHISRQGLELAAQPHGAGRIGSAQHRRQIRILGEHHGQGAVSLQFAAQDRSVKRAGRRGLMLRGLPRVPARDLAAGHNNQQGDEAPRGREQPPLSRMGHRTAHRSTMRNSAQISKACVWNYAQIEARLQAG